jgi:hypothetical protein
MQDQNTPPPPVNIGFDLFVQSLAEKFPALEVVRISENHVALEFQKSTWGLRQLMDGLYELIGVFNGDGEKFQKTAISCEQVQSLLFRINDLENPKDPEPPQEEPPSLFQPLPSPWGHPDQKTNRATQVSEKMGFKLMEGVSTYQLKHIVKDLQDKLDADVYLDDDDCIVIKTRKVVFLIVPMTGQRFDLFKGPKKLLSSKPYAEILSRVFDMLDEDITQVGGDETRIAFPTGNGTMQTVNLHEGLKLGQSGVQRLEEELRVGLAPKNVPETTVEAVLKKINEDVEPQKFKNTPLTLREKLKSSQTWSGRSPS